MGSRKGESTTSFGWDHIFGQGVKGHRSKRDSTKSRVKGHQLDERGHQKRRSLVSEKGAWCLDQVSRGTGKGLGAGLRCHRAGVVVPGRRAGGRRCWSSTVIRSGNRASTSNGNSMAHCAR